MFGNRVGAGGNLLGGARGVAVVVDADGGEIGAEPGLKKSPAGGVERAAGGAQRIIDGGRSFGFGRVRWFALQGGVFLLAGRAFAADARRRWS